MRVAYLDCNAGISGNMFLGAMIDLGLPQSFLLGELNKLAVELPKIRIEKVQRKGLAAMLVDVQDTHEHHHRHLSDISKIIEESQLGGRVKANAVRCFENLAEAEAKVHGVSVEMVHFHEVGALDAIVDIVGAAIGIEYFKFERMFCSSIRVGYGTTKCAHGEIVLPAPATVELLNGYTVFGGDLSGEWATPTGAAIIKTFVQTELSLPLMKKEASGYGAGTSERVIPNVLRIISGNLQMNELNEESQMVLETNIDDMNPELFGYVGEKLLEAGVKDFYFTPIYMKKNRPATKLSIIVEKEKVPEIEKLIFVETTTLGIRKMLVQRTCMERSFITVTVNENPVRVKLGMENGRIIKWAPEYEDCQKVARATGRPLHEIYEAAGCSARKLAEVEG